MILCDFGKHCSIATSTVGMIPVFAAAFAMCQMITDIVGTYFGWEISILAIYACAQNHPCGHGRVLRVCRAA
jgi:hypothetical protein